MITSVGSLVGWALLTSLAPIRHKIEAVGANSIPDAPDLFDCDRAYLVPETADDRPFRQKLTEILEREKPELVFPGRDEELGCLASLRDSNRFDGTVFLAPPSPLVPVFNDKLETFRFATRCGLPFARIACSPSDVESLVRERGFPLIAKPRFHGHASKNVYLVQTSGQLQELLGDGGYLFQECLNPDTLPEDSRKAVNRGIPWAAPVRDFRHETELVIGRDGKVCSLSMVCSDTEGPLQLNMRVLDDDDDMRRTVSGYARRLAELGYRGPFNIQAKKEKDGRFVPFELNGRLTGSSVARAFLGYNQTIHVVEHFLEGCGPWPRHDGDGGVAVTRQPVFRTLDRHRVGALARNGEWRGASPDPACDEARDGRQSD